MTDPRFLRTLFTSDLSRSNCPSFPRSPSTFYARQERRTIRPGIFYGRGTYNDKSVKLSRKLQDINTFVCEN